MIWSLRCRRLPMRFAGLASVSTSAVETIGVGRSVSVPVATAKFASGDVTNGRVMQFVVVPEPGAGVDRRQAFLRRAKILRKAGHIQ